MEAEFIDLRSFLIKMFNAVNFHLSTALAAAYKSAMLLLSLYLVILTSVLVPGWLMD